MKKRRNHQIHKYCFFGSCSNCCTMVCAENGFELQVIDLMVLRMVCPENGIEYNTYNTSLCLELLVLELNNGIEHLLKKEEESIKYTSIVAPIMLNTLSTNLMCNQMAEN